MLLSLASATTGVVAARAMIDVMSAMEKRMGVGVGVGGVRLLLWRVVGTRAVVSECTDGRGGDNDTSRAAQKLLIPLALSAWRSSCVVLVRNGVCWRVALQ